MAIGFYGISVFLGMLIYRRNLAESPGSFDKIVVAAHYRSYNLS